MSDLVTQVLDVVARFADSGRSDPLRCGMTLQNVEELIGPSTTECTIQNLVVGDLGRTSGMTWKS